VADDAQADGAAKNDADKANDVPDDQKPPADSAKPEGDAQDDAAK